MYAVTCSCAFKCSSMCLAPSLDILGVSRAVDLFVPTSTSKGSFLLRLTSFSRHPCSKRHGSCSPRPLPMSLCRSCLTECRREGEPRFHVSQNHSRALSFEVGESLKVVIIANYPINPRM